MIQSRALSGEDLTVEHVWDVAVEGAPVSLADWSVMPAEPAIMVGELGQAVASFSLGGAGAAVAVRPKAD